MDGVQIPSAGDVFLGTWRIEKQVGKGGFSVVYRAVDQTGRVAALKILLPESDQEGSSLDYDQDLVERFLREARLLETLDSPYTIRMWDYGQSKAGLLYMIFEFINGRSLFQEIKTQGALAPDRVIHILRQTLVGLQFAHQLGILHRDIKPNNIMLFARGDDPDRVKLVDFGIAKMYGEATGLPGNDLTAAGLLVGTPRYMSPEQLKGGVLGPPSDVYSMGLCAIEMLTGRKCIPGKDRFKIVEAQLRPEPVTLPDDIAVPAGLRNVVHRMTQKKVQARYRSAAEALRALEALAGDPGATGDTVFESVPASLQIPDEAPKAEEEETVLHRVNAAELDSLIAEQGSADVADPHDETVALNGPPSAMQRDAGASNSGLRARGTRPPDAGTSTSGLHAHGPQQRDAGASISGLHAHQSGQFPNASASNSGLNPHPNRRHPDASSSGLNPRQPGQVPDASRSNSGINPTPGPPTPADQLPSPPDDRAPNPFGREVPGDGPMTMQPGQDLPAQQRSLDSKEKKALIASFLLPGVGHLLIGQTVKGIGALLLLLLTVGIGWVLLAPCALIDAFLVIRARKRRSVDDLEFFPDIGDLL